jgi:hypothetical protein
MSDYNPGKLLLVCDTIIEDGELTYDELYQLAEWLNGHREACAHWPGDRFVKLLQKAWADSKIARGGETRGRGGFCLGSRDCIQSRSHVLNDRNA